MSTFRFSRKLPTTRMPWDWEGQHRRFFWLVHLAGALETALRSEHLSSPGTTAGGRASPPARSSFTGEDEMKERRKKKKPELFSGVLAGTDVGIWTTVSAFGFRRELLTALLAGSPGRPP